MGGTLWACGPGQTPSTVSDTDDGVSMYYRYSGFTELKGIILNATITFLTALSGKQIAKKLLIDEGIVTPETVENLEEAIVIANYRSRIDAAIPLLKSWLKTKADRPLEDPILKMFGGAGSLNPMSNLGRLLDQRSFIAEIMAEVPIDFNVVNPKNLEPEKLGCSRPASRRHGLAVHPMNPSSNVLLSNATRPRYEAAQGKINPSASKALHGITGTKNKTFQEEIKREGEGGNCVTCALTEEQAKRTRFK
ncbi:hypothetical protein B0H19DRAFT_1081476 [Mycena capillaripes]|nr:hypothetical protein B0H19DRAFT_1081476 [Mycena capillaripes]